MGIEEMFSKNLVWVHDENKTGEGTDTTAVPGRSLKCKQHDPDVYFENLALAARVEAQERKLVQKEELFRSKQKTLGPK